MPFNSFSVVMVLITPSALKQDDTNSLDVGQVAINEGNGLNLLTGMSFNDEVFNQLISITSASTMFDVPLLDSGEIKSHLTVGEGFLIQVSSVPSDECRHVIA